MKKRVTGGLPMLNPRTVLVPLISASIFFGACDSQVRGVFHGALTSTPINAAIVNFSPQALPILPVPGFGCPLVPPFRTNFALIVDGRASGDMFLHQVGFQFLDGSGVGRTR